jgi:ATP-dependent DNA helicase RecG
MQQKRIEGIKAVLLPPLRFASRENYTHVHRLRGFESLLETTVGQYPDLDDDTRRNLLEIGHGFENASPEKMKVKIEALLSFFDEVGEGKAFDRPLHSGKDRSGSDGRSSGPSKAAPSKKSIVTDSKDTKPSRKSNSVRGAPSKKGSVEQITFLETALEALRGIGPSKATALRERDIGDVGDLLYIVPRTYADRRYIAQIGNLEQGVTAVVKGEIVSSTVIGHGRGSRYEVLLDDGSGRMKLVFFHYKQFDMQRRFAPGKFYTAAGEPVIYRGTFQMVHPNVAQGQSTELLSGIQPIYPELRGLHPAELGRAIHAAVQLLRTQRIIDNLPNWIRERAAVCSFEDMMVRLHDPHSSLNDSALSDLIGRTSSMHRRLAFEELLMLQISLRLKASDATRNAAWPIVGDTVKALAKELLPFQLTNAQDRTTGEIFNDLESDRPMARLLQGDVGAGKTAVATLAMFRAVRSGFQAALMAPTEILAEQHYQTIRAFFSPLGIRVGLLTGSTKTKDRKLLLARLKNGEFNCMVGTHALIGDDVHFSKLALCIIDEQHRFGVAQRAQFQSKGSRLPNGKTADPHLLIMTATPIPRSLALTCYGDLDVSVLDERPPGRQPIETRVLRGDYQQAFSAIEEALQKGQCAYVVYPLIEESEKLDLADATRGYEKLKRRLGDEKVALIHGRMPAEERDTKMAAFAAGELSVLVSTTVIEVGVDVPAATCMVIVNAERFGLSQLHQLRGRVGRGMAASHCFLLMGEDGAGKDAFRRLAIMEKTNDGFLIAEEDLAIRGPGDFLGTRQSGIPNLIFADLYQHAALLETARTIATELLDADPMLADPNYQSLYKSVQTRFQRKFALMDAG